MLAAVTATLLAGCAPFASRFDAVVPYAYRADAGAPYGYRFDDGAPYAYRIDIGTRPAGLYEIQCDIGGQSLQDCYTEAKRRCPRGFEVIETAADRAWQQRGELLFDRLYVGKPPRRVLTVACR